MTRQQSRPDLRIGAAENSLAATKRITDPGIDAATRPRCLRCSHPVDAPRSVARGFGSLDRMRNLRIRPRSVARGFGPVCWTRTVAGQLDARRDAVGRVLAALARRVARLDAAELAVAAAALASVEEVAE